MKSHFSILNQISINQSFLDELQNPGFLSKWKEIHKGKRKKRSFFYLSLLKKQKRAHIKKKNSIISNYNIRSEINNYHALCHKSLFKHNKNLPELKFFNDFGQKSWKSFIHTGYNLHGEILICHAKSHILKY